MRIFCKQGLILSVVLLSTAILVGCSTKDQKTPKAVADKSGEVVGEVDVISIIPATGPAKDGTGAAQPGNVPASADGQKSELKSDQPSGDQGSATPSAGPTNPPAETTDSQTQSAFTWDEDAAVESESTFGFKRFRGWGSGYNSCCPPTCGPVCAPVCAPTCAPTCAPACGPVCGPCVKPWKLFRRCAMPCAPICAPVCTPVCNPCDPCGPCGTSYSPACAPCQTGCDSTGCCDGATSDNGDDNGDNNGDDGDDNDADDDTVLIEGVIIESDPTPSANTPAAKNTSATSQSQVTPLNSSNRSYNTYSGSGLRTAQPTEAIGSDASKAVGDGISNLPEAGTSNQADNTSRNAETQNTETWSDNTGKTVENPQNKSQQAQETDNSLKMEQIPAPTTNR